MVKLSSLYWKKFVDTDENDNERGNGTEFEKLINSLLLAMYGEQWIPTKGSHDNNRDFWIHLSDQSIWAECKNYSKTIAMNILAPTLVMAQIYEVNEILFFSRSKINRFAKNKILAFGEKVNKSIRFFDGEPLEDLIYAYASKLPEKYSPYEYIDSYDSVEEKCSFIDVYFFQNIVSSVYDTAEFFQSYEQAEFIYYNETFALTFCLLNNWGEDQVDVSIEFMDEGTDRYSFQYFYPTIVPEKKMWYQACLKKGEGRSVSLNMRQIVYKHETMLPRFHIKFVGINSGKQYDWYSKKITVKSSWIGTTKLIGSNYINLLKDVNQQLLNNPYLSALIIAGSSGTGKTRILQECQNVFLRNGYRIISLTGQEDFSSHYFIKEIIAFLYEIPSDEIIELLEDKINSTNVNQGTAVNTDVETAINLLRLIINNVTEEDLQNILNIYATIIYEKLSQHKIVLMIDNLQFTGKVFQKFIQDYVFYSVNKQTVNQAILVAVFNTDYMTSKTSELLYNLLHANIKHCLSTTLEGFKEPEHGILFLQELTRTSDDKNKRFFSEIIDRISLKPYNLFQMVKYLEELDIINISPNMTGTIIPSLKKYEALSCITNGIVSVLEHRFKFICEDIPWHKLMRILSIIYIFDSINGHLQQIFQITNKELELLCKKNILRTNSSGIYIFDHDIIRNFYFSNYSQYIWDCLKFVKQEGLEDKIKKCSIAYLLYKIIIEKDKDVIIDTGAKITQVLPTDRIASLFYNNLLDAFIDLLENQIYEGIYIKYIHQICSFIRQYDGSLKAWYRSKDAFDTIQAYYPQALCDDIIYYRPFIHFCCDILVQKHMYSEEIAFIKEILEKCKNICPINAENKDELNVLIAIMYNRWYISYNTQSYKKDIQSKRQYLIEKSRSYGKKINNPQKRGLIEYLNNSDEGYNYYGYQKDKDILFSIWDKCICDIPTLVPEKTLNYYRKTVQYGLIECNKAKVDEETSKAMEYLTEGKYSHEPVIFKTFFLMAEVMSNIQDNPKKNYYYNAEIIDDIIKMQQLLDNHKFGDILLLKGVNAFYGGNADEVYYSFKEAYRYYAAGETSRYWIKKDLLQENIHYTFTKLGIYMAGYDTSFLPNEYRQPLILFDGDHNNFVASGIQRTKDLHLNLPLI